jgi:hypothetical protein
MKNYSFFLIGIFALYFVHVNGQDNLKEFVLTIVDTTKPETEQAKSIYNWITKNIVYDVKSYISVSPKSLSPEKTLKARKGLCFEYANLMAALCNSVGIETYVIYGYSKGTDYYPGKVFLHSNHCWNIIRVDSTWIVADPTWGSGYIGTKIKIFSGLLGSVGFNPMMKQNQIFIKEYNPDYFNISSVKLLKKHYPLDPKWLFGNNPPSYKAFESGYIDSSLIDVNWKNEINVVINKSQDFRLINDGETASYYNINNLFDWGYAIYQSTAGFDFQRQITHENYDQFMGVDEKLTKTIALLTRQQQISDSIYRIRYSGLKAFYSNHSHAYKTIENEIMNAKKSFRQNKKNNSNKANGIYKKIASNETKINILQETHLKEKKLLAMSDSDQQHDGEFRISLTDNEMEQLAYKPRLDSLNEVMEQLLTADAILNDSILLIYQEFNDQISKLYFVIITGDEVQINNQSDSVWNSYTTSSYLIERKKNNAGKMNQIAQVFTENRSKWEELLKEEQKQLKDIYKTYKLPDAVYDIYEQSLYQNIQMYQSQIDFEHKILTHYDLQNGFIVATRQQLKKLQKSEKHEFKQFNEWYKKKMDWETLNYKKDKDNLIEILKGAIEKRKIISKKNIAPDQIVIQ